MAKLLRDQVRDAVEEAMRPFVQGPGFGMYMIPLNKKEDLIHAIADQLCESGIFVEHQIVPIRDIIIRALLSDAVRNMTSKQDLAEYIATKIEEAS